MGDYLPILVIVCLVVMAIITYCILYKRFRGMTNANARNDKYEISYMAPGTPEQVLALLEDTSCVEKMYSSYIPDHELLCVWHTGMGGSKQYKMKLTQKGAHTRIDLSLYAFTLGRGVKMDVFMRARLKAEPIAPKGK